MDNHEDSTVIEEPTAVEEVSHRSLMEKIKQINFVKWGKRAAIAGGVVLVGVVAVAVTKDKTETEED
jgi:hypothetical protein